MRVTRTFVALIVATTVGVIASAGLGAQGGAAMTFKLGTFEQGGRTFVGLVLRDAQIVDIARANTAYEQANASAPGIWERKPGDTRDNPYLFLKSPSVIIGNGDSIVVPRGRVQIDFECEFATVIGKPAHYVPIDKAADYIFGYTAHHDVSDRQGRGDRKMGGSDWLIGKNHDTFGPLGPYIVPKEFIKDPMNVRHTMYLNGMVMQDSNTRNMSHNIWEMLSFASNITTLNPGDVISGGSPAGTNLERPDPRWMRAGDNAKCEIEGIGALSNPVVAEAATSTK